MDILNVLADEDPFKEYLDGSVPEIVKVLGESTVDDVVVKRVVFHSRVIDGKNEQLYAVIARPAAEGNYPGVLYLHGGTQVADPDAAIKWAENRYIALSFDEPGIADPARCPDSTGPFKDMPYGSNRFFAQPDITHSMLFSAVVAEIKAFNLLCSQPGVIKDRIGITGISWGGYSTTMLAGLLGDRVSAAYSVFGCGCYDKGTVFDSELKKMPADDAKIWLQYLNAGRRTSSIKAKFFIAAAVRDHFFWPTAVMNTLNEIQGAKNQLFAPQLSHSLEGALVEDTSLIYFDYYLKGKGAPFPVVKVNSFSAQADGSKKVVFDVYSATPVKEARLYFSKPGDVWEERTWTYINANSIGNNRFKTTFPAQEVNEKVDWYVSASDDRPVTVSSYVYGSSQDICSKYANLLSNTFYKLNKEKSLTIGYFGGSITEGAGASDAEKTSWRALTTAWFKKEYPDCEIKSIQASIGGTGSDLGMFRCDRDLLNQKNDLVFVEFTVNDYGKDKERMARSLEGIVRRIWEANKYTDIVFVYTIMKRIAPVLDRGEKVEMVEVHQEIADYYNIPSIDVGKVLWKNVSNGQGTWEEYLVDGVHPSDAGYAVYSETVRKFLSESIVPCKEPVPRTIGGPLKESVLVKSCMADAWDAQQEGWTKLDETMAGRFPHMLVCNIPGTELNFRFKGTAIGLYWLIAPDSGDIEWSVDKKEAKVISSWDHYALSSSRAFYQILTEELEPGEHCLKIRILKEKQPESKGTWIRIGAFLVGEKA
jgi:lysophospholipase L1-like esterase/cephalosporin-C deacetylase-like acetyl esterase